MRSMRIECASARSLAVPNSSRSPPALKHGPFADTCTARMSSSIATSLNASVSASRIGTDSAFRVSGLFSTMSSRSPSRCSNTMSSSRRGFVRTGRAGAPRREFATGLQRGIRHRFHRERVFNGQPAHRAEHLHEHGARGRIPFDRPHDRFDLMGFDDEIHGRVRRGTDAHDRYRLARQPTHRPTRNRRRRAGRRRDNGGSRDRDRPNWARRRSTRDRQARQTT